MSESNVPQVAILMGSSSDYEIMKPSGEALAELGVTHEMRVLSAHRTPTETVQYVSSCAQGGTQVFIAGAGGAAHLPGVVAAYTIRPVIGIPVPNGPLNGQDALLSIVQMPRGMPVATVAIGNAYNAGLLAAQIIAAGDPAGAVAQRLVQYREQLRQRVLDQKLPCHS